MPEMNMLLMPTTLGILLLFLSPTAAFGHGPMFQPGGPVLPPFLRNVSNQARREFFELVRSPNATKTAVQSNLAAWAQQNGVQAAYQNFTQNQQQRAEQVRSNLTQYLAGPALELLNNYWNVRQNMAITRTAECQEIRRLLETAPVLLRRLVPIPPSVIPGPPPRACFRRNPMQQNDGSDANDHDDGEGSRRMRRGTRVTGVDAADGDDEKEVPEPNGQEQEDVLDAGDTMFGVAQ